MSTWGMKAFENDDAADWISDLIEADDLSPVDRALSTVIATKDYLERPESQVALAAAEIIALLRGKPDQDCIGPEELDAWIARVKPKLDTRLAGKADDAINRILTEPSELLEL